MQWRIRGNGKVSGPAGFCGERYRHNGPSHVIGCGRSIKLDDFRGGGYDDNVHRGTGGGASGGAFEWLCEECWLRLSWTSADVSVRLTTKREGDVSLLDYLEGVTTMKRMGEVEKLQTVLNLLRTANRKLSEVDGKLLDSDCGRYLDEITAEADTSTETTRGIAEDIG